MPVETAELHRRSGLWEARGHSASYEELAARTAEDGELLAFIDGLPADRRQPDLLLATVRHLGGPTGDFTAFRTWVLGHWDEVRRTVLERRTRTNEPGRCATLLPLLAACRSRSR